MALLTLTALMVRPIAADIAGVSSDPAQIEIVGLLDGGHLCLVDSACDTMTPSSIGLDFTPTPFTFAVAGILILLTVVSRLSASTMIPAPKNPPPRFVA